MLNKIHTNIKSIITTDWNFHFSNLEILRPLKLFQLHDCFLYGIELDILTGNTHYRAYFKFISLFNAPNKIDFNNYILSQFVLDKKDFPFEIPIAHHRDLYKNALIAAELQSPFDLFVPITKEGIINVLEKNISNQKYQSIIDLPYKEYQFLIQFAALFMTKNTSNKIFKKYLTEIQKLPDQRMNYFVGNKEEWLDNLKNEHDNPRILEDNIEKNILLNKLTIPKKHLID